MTYEREEANGAFGVIRSPRARAARYRDHAAHFARLAEAEKPFENPLRGMPLLPRGSLIRCQDPDDPGKRIQLRARRRSTAPVPGRHENASIFATVRGSIPKRRAASRRLSPSTYTARRTCPYSSTRFIPPPTSAAPRQMGYCCRIFTPVQPVYPAASVRDFLSGALRRR